MTAGKLRPAQLIQEGDSEAVLRLFSEVLEVAEGATRARDKRSVVMPGPFWLLARLDPPLSRLEEVLEGSAGAAIPAWFARNFAAIRQDPVHEALRYCLLHGPQSGVPQGRDLCRVMAAVAQTLNCTNQTIVLRNRTIAERVGGAVPGPEWTDEDVFVASRPDERGGYVERRGIQLWMASHKGPAFADKAENQDAVCALPCGNGIAFAVADGVSTSLGSRFAAAITAHRFCRELQVLSQAEEPMPAAALIEACRRTQSGLDDMLDKMLSETGGAVQQLFETSSLHPRAVEAVLNNTKTAEKPSLQPALATTLVGGLIQPSKQTGKWRCVMVRVGDGAVEIAHSDGSIERRFSIDPETMAISASMGPGPRSRRCLEQADDFIDETVIESGDRLLVSSDGLARGHYDAVWCKIYELTGDVFSYLKRRDGNSAACLLRALAEAADFRHEHSALFDDNLSLIVVTAG